MSKPKRPKPRRGRNWHAVNAQFMTGAGHHGDERKERSRRRCRGKIRDW